MYGVPGKGAAGGGGLAVTGAAVGSWVIAAIGLIIVGSFLVFLAARAGRS